MRHFLLDVKEPVGRDVVFAELGSFDHSGMDPAEFERRTLALLDAPGVHCAADALAHFRRRLLDEPPQVIFPLTCLPEGSIEEILAHRYTFYGETHDAGADIDWERSPGTTHWASDLHRFSYMTVLERALRETRDERLAREMIALILDWIAKADVCKPFPRERQGYTWCYLNTAIHLEVWLTALAEVFKQFPDLITPPDWLRIVKSVYDQLGYLDIVIPEAVWANNWITIGTRCMLTALATFRDFRRSREWTQTAIARLKESIDAQVLPDGVQDELTQHYHLCVVQNMIQPLLVEQHLPMPMPPTIRKHLKPMLHYLRQCVTPDGKSLNFNDGDADAKWEYDITLNHPVARALLADEIDREVRSELFPYGGVAILRQGSRRGRDELFLAFDGGPFGSNHQHEDALSFWLSAYDRPFIVDSGRHLYDERPHSYFPYLKTTRAHSTILIDGHGQNARAHPDRWHASAPLPLLWKIDPDGSVTAGSTYDLGYGPASIPVTHRREIRFVPEPGYWIITDTVEGDGEHQIESRFQFAPGELQINGATVTTKYPDANLLLATEPGRWQGIDVECGQEKPQRAGWYSDGYNKIEPAPALVLRTTAKLPFTSRIVLHPYHGVTPPSVNVKQASSMQ